MMLQHVSPGPTGYAPAGHSMYIFWRRTHTPQAWGAPREGQGKHREGKKGGDDGPGMKHACAHTSSQEKLCPMQIWHLAGTAQLAGGKLAQLPVRGGKGETGESWAQRLGGACRAKLHGAGSWAWAVQERSRARGMRQHHAVK